MRSWNRPAAATITGGAAVAVLGSFLPWIGTGSSARTSYELVDLVDRLGFTPDGVVSWLLRLWPLAPLLLVLGAVSQWVALPAAAAEPFVRRVVPLVGAMYVGGVAAAVRTAPGAELLKTGAGPSVAMAGAAIMAVGVVLSFVFRPEGSVVR